MNIRDRLRKHIAKKKTSKPAKVKKPERAYEDALKHFEPVLHGSDSFRMSEREFLGIEAFIEFFGDLVEKKDYRKSSFVRRNLECDLLIHESVFDEWLARGCLLDS